MIRFHSYLSSICVSVELLQTITNCKELFLDLGVVSFGIHQHAACVRDGLAILQQDCAKPLA